MKVYVHLIGLVAGCHLARRKSSGRDARLWRDATGGTKVDQMHPKVRAFRREIPWVIKYKEYLSPDGIRVSRVDENLLTRIRSKYCSDIDSPGDEVIVLVNMKGEELIRVWAEIPWKYSSLWARIFARGYDWFNSVGGALSYLEKQGLLEDVAYAVSLFEGVTVYKPPTGHTLTSWLEELDKRAQGELARAIKAIDDEAISA